MILIISRHTMIRQSGTLTKLNAAHLFVYINGQYASLHISQKMEVSLATPPHADDFLMAR